MNVTNDKNNKYSRSDTRNDSNDEKPMNLANDRSTQNRNAINSDDSSDAERMNVDNVDECSDDEFMNATNECQNVRRERDSKNNECMNVRRLDVANFEHRNLQKDEPMNLAECSNSLNVTTGECMNVRQEKVKVYEGADGNVSEECSDDLTIDESSTSTNDKYDDINVTKNEEEDS